MQIDIFIVSVALSSMLYCQFAVADTQVLNREQQIAEKLAQTAETDEVISLKARGGDFIGLYKSARSQETGKSNEVNAHPVVILVHGMGAHPDWPDVISPLRIQLTELGWSTFSIQMPIQSAQEPIANYGRTLTIANSRIHGAIEYLNAWEMKPIILLGYGFGAAQAANFLASDKAENVTAFVSVSVLAQKFIKPRLNLYKLFGEINIPILDIYGEDDLEDVRSGIDDRRLAANKNTPRTLQQIELQQAGHHYSGSEKALAEQIYVWLQQNVAVIGASGEIDEITTEISYEKQ